MSSLNTFKHALQAENFVAIAQLTGERHRQASSLTTAVKTLRGSVVALLVTDNPLDNDQSPLARARLIRDNGLDSIVELSCKGRNRIALMSELLGLRALDCSSILVSNTDHTENYPRPTHELDDLQLLGLAESLNEQDADVFDELLIGIRCTALAEMANPTHGRLSQKAQAGAQFLLTPVCCDSQQLHQTMNAMVEERMTWHYSVIASLACPTSLEELEQLKRIDPGCEIPIETHTRIENASNPIDEGIAICAELIRQIQDIPGINGINLLVLSDPQHVVEALNRAAD